MDGRTDAHDPTAVSTPPETNRQEPPIADEALGVAEAPRVAERAEERWLDQARQFLRQPATIPFLALLVVTLAWIVKYSQLVVWRHDRFGSFDFDSGIYDQAAWLSAHGSQFDTVRGLPLYGHHATLGFFLFAPFYLLGLGGPNVMNVAQVLALGAVPLVVYWVARRLGLEPWIAGVAGFVCLIHFSMSWLAQELFHPEVFAIAPLLAAYGFALREQNRAYWAMLFFAVIWKEDVALAIVGLGAVLLLQRHRRRGAYTMLLGVAWFAAVTKILLPHFSPTGKAFYAEGFYGNLGNDFGSVGMSFLTHSSRVVDHLQTANAIGYVRDLWTPFAFINLLAPSTLLIAVPQLLANLLSVNSFTWSLRFHYAALPLMASMLGFVLGLRRLRSGPLRSFAAGVALAAAIATALTWGVGPYSRNYRAGFWPLTTPSNQQSLEHAVSLVPSNASVSASYHLVPHLSDRAKIYSFPNPWRPRNWGINDLHQQDPKKVEWIVVSKVDLGNDDESLLEQILADPSIRMVYDDGNVVVARRTKVK
jgi:uncharacterized membrane protein